MNERNIPEWLLNLENEDLEFVRKFILSSGSLKKIAKEYGVSYPTVRNRLDILIQKINLNEQTEENTFINYIKTLTIDEKINLNDAKKLIDLYKKEIKKGWDLNVWFIVYSYFDYNVWITIFFINKV